MIDQIQTLLQAIDGNEPSPATIYPAMELLIQKDANCTEEAIAFFQQRGAELFQRLLREDFPLKASDEERKLLGLYAALTVTHAPIDKLIFLLQMVPDRVIKYMAERATDATALVSYFLELYVKKLAVSRPARFPIPSTGKVLDEKESWTAEIAFIEPIVSLLLTTAVVRQAEVSQEGKEPFQEEDRCSEILSILSFFLLFESGKRAFVHLDGFCTLSTLAAQAQSVTAVTAVLSAFHSCVFNVTDQVNPTLDVEPSTQTEPHESKEYTEKLGRKSTLYETVVNAFALMRPALFLESVMERFYGLRYTTTVPLYTPEQLRDQVESLSFGIVMLLHDCVLPETTTLASETNLLFVADYIIDLTRDVDVTKQSLWKSDGSLETFNGRVKAAIEAIMRLITLHTNPCQAIGCLLNRTQDEEDMKGEVVEELKAEGSTGTEPRNLIFLDAVLRAIGATDNPHIAGTLISLLSLMASYSCQTDKKVSLPVSRVHYVRLLTWIASYGAYVLGGHTNMLGIIQYMEDACLALVWLIESVTIDENDHSQRDEIWKHLSALPEAHGVLMLALALSIIKGLVVTLTGLLSLLSCLMNVEGYFTHVVSVFPDKKEELCEFLVSLCADLSKQGTFCYVVCNNILKGLSYYPETVELVTPEKLAEAILPLGFDDNDDEVLLRLLKGYKEVPSVIRQASERILAIMDAIDETEAGEVNKKGDHK
ncbi:hypothetical protein GMRT_11909 [Giardia muris]|uniref:Neurochondrin n=1 Tax=Giardia muris TaxID=5742 RepID=A0A4Z1SRK1_GIAMU|nr:hypothetical protein GMRT_11909 [Giardia muris]|eukprot:TNJ28522.1 hypothetical protein GMRT_11909 [Giardia muris]